MPEYTIATVLTMVAVVLIELLWFRTGIFRKPRFWIAMVIMLSFQVLVDGWLTKLSAPIVIYDDARTSGIRWPFDIPIEDFGFGFAMITLTLIVWLRVTGRGRPTSRPDGQDPRAADADAGTDDGAGVRPAVGPAARSAARPDAEDPR